ncbi:hypothetical protein M6B38_259320 [Iris pallida]|uniref:Uncharacterized protein n=1 Tax=Iris pallida TaxID=29817 RepID=A0AAX6IE32_IRIPA|nr:hypothetical protein M6B38_259320 [Iris pallida]
MWPRLSKGWRCRRGASVEMRYRSEKNPAMARQILNSRQFVEVKRSLWRDPRRRMVGDRPAEQCSGSGGVGKYARNKM